MKTRCVIRKAYVLALTDESRDFTISIHNVYAASEDAERAKFMAMQTPGVIASIVESRFIDWEEYE